MFVAAVRNDVAQVAVVQEDKMIVDVMKIGLLLLR